MAKHPVLDIHSKEFQLKARHFLDVLPNAQAFRNWIKAYLDIDLPFDTVDPDSNSNPIDALWSVYETVRDNKGDQIPGYIYLSARECYKTLGASILEVMLLLHFKTSIAHMAAIEKQSQKAISYINGFFKKLKPYLDANGWKKISDSKTKIQFSEPSGREPYITVIICTAAGANSEHVPIMFIDEIDVVRDPKAYEEAKLIPGIDRGIFPITVKLSTRKYSFGLMQQEIDHASASGEQIKRWNVLDITERCPESRHKPEEPMQEVYVAKSLPLKTITPEQYENEVDKNKWEKIEAYSGCLSCDLLPVCKTRLAKRTAKATGGLFRPIQATINSFKRVSPEMAEAQLLCWKPSTKGLVYPRFEPNEGGNVINIVDAIRLVTGESNIKNADMDSFVSVLQQWGYSFHAGLDWGYTHESAFVIMATAPMGYHFIIDCFAEPGLELSEFVQKCVEYQEKYPIHRWFCDQAQPSHIKTLQRALKQVNPSAVCPDFVKDVMGGIEAIRSIIVTTKGTRKLLILNTEANQKVIHGFKVHHFKLDARGNPTTTPDDEAFADIMDCIRYLGQNLFSGSKRHKVFLEGIEHNQQPTAGSASIDDVNTRLMEEKIAELTGGGSTKVKGKKGKIMWSV